MSSVIRFGQVLGLISLLALSGCCTKCKSMRSGCPTCGTGQPFQPSAGAVNAPYGASNGPGAPFSPGPGGLPPGATTTPPPSPPPGQGGLVPAPAANEPGPTASNGSGSGDAVASNSPSDGGEPQTIVQKPFTPNESNDPVPERPADAIKLQPPQAGTSESTAQKPASPGVTGDASPVLDIPNFAMVKPRIATGLKPFPDGINWLKSKGYHAVVHIRPPSDKETSTGISFQNQNIQYLTLEASPETLNRDLVDKFNRLVTDSANQPLFVFDKDGSLAGPLWYLYFRISEGVSDEKARLETSRIGYKLPTETENKTMADAINRVLQGNP